MSRRVVQRVKISKNDMSEDMNHMFKQMMGEEMPDYSIARPKYEKLLKIMQNISTLLMKFSNQLEKRFPEYAKYFQEMIEYASLLKGLCVEFDIAPLPPFDVNSPTTKETMLKYIELVCKQYMALKKNNNIQRLVIICKDLSTYTKYIKNTEKLSAEFIYESPDPDLCILRKMTQLPFKQLYLSEKISKLPNAQSYILTFLHVLLGETTQIFELLSSPDIDIDKFTTIITNAIGQLKGHPELKGCDAAFDKIKSSTNMLKENFNSYYGDFVSSNNPNIIMEEFISDVSRKVEGNARLVLQFKKIMGFYRKQLQKQKNVSPHVMGMMNFVGNKLDNVDTSQLPKHDDDDGSDESDSEEQLEKDSEKEAEELPELVSKPIEEIPTSSTSSTSNTATSSTSSTSKSSAAIVEDADDEPIKKITKISKKKGKK